MEKYKYKPPTFWQRFKKEPLFALRLLYANICDKIYWMFNKEELGGIRLNHLLIPEIFYSIFHHLYHLLQ